MVEIPTYASWYSMRKALIGQHVSEPKSELDSRLDQVLCSGQSVVDVPLAYCDATGLAAFGLTVSEDGSIVSSLPNDSNAEFTLLKDEIVRIDRTLSGVQERLNDLVSSSQKFGESLNELNDSKVKELCDRVSKVSASVDQCIEDVHSLSTSNDERVSRLSAEIKNASSAITKDVTNHEKLAAIRHSEVLARITNTLSQGEQLLKDESKLIQAEILKQIGREDYQQKLTEFLNTYTSALLRSEATLGNQLLALSDKCVSNYQAWLVRANEIASVKTELLSQLSTIYASLPEIRTMISSMSDISSQCESLSETQTFIASMMANLISRVPAVNRLDDILRKIDITEKTAAVHNMTASAVNAVSAANGIKDLLKKDDL